MSRYGSAMILSTESDTRRTRLAGENLSQCFSKSSRHSGHGICRIPGLLCARLLIYSIYFGYRPESITIFRYVNHFYCLLLHGFILLGALSMVYGTGSSVHVYRWRRVNVPERNCGKGSLICFGACLRAWTLMNVCY